MPKTVPMCRTCEGTGAIPETLENGTTRNWQCSRCNGSGRS